MTDSLASLIERLKKDISSYATNEAAIKQGMVLSILSRLGWDITNVREEVVPEYSTGKGRVDYCLKSGGQSRVFIEVKGIAEDLEKHQEQLLQYAFEEGIELSVLTNGRSWWLYLPTLRGHWEQRKFYAIDLEKQEAQEIEKNLSELLSKHAVSTSSALQRARALHEGKERERKIDQALPEAWHRLVNEPDELLVDLLADATESSCGYKPEAERAITFLKTIALPPHTPQPLSPPKTPSRRKTTRKHKDDLTHTLARSFALLDVDREVNTWKELLIGVCEIINEYHPDEFPKVLSLEGRKRPHFSKKPGDLRNAGRIPNTPIYVETGFAAKDIRRRCDDILKLFGYSPEDLKIYTD